MRFLSVVLLVTLGGCAPPSVPLPDGLRALRVEPDPAVITDPAVRERIRGSGRPWLVVDDASGIELVLVPAGSYARGAPDGDRDAAADERPVHPVVVRAPLYVGRCEVTQAQWAAVMGDAPSFFRGPDLPVEQVDLFRITEFLGTAGFELPTEAEWEYFARAGDAPFELEARAWFRSNAGGRTHPVGARTPNAFGLHDVLGNVGEWTASPYLADEYARHTGPLDAAVVRARGAQVTFRGGSWYDAARRVRPTARSFGAWSLATGHLGFRVIRRLEDAGTFGGQDG